ncbi:hypothetical protein GCM10022221_42910 [Actinocorallia aurea]
MTQKARAMFLALVSVATLFAAGPAAADRLPSLNDHELNNRLSWYCLDGGTGSGVVKAAPCDQSPGQVWSMGCVPTSEGSCGSFGISTRPGLCLTSASPVPGSHVEVAPCVFPLPISQRWTAWSVVNGSMGQINTRGGCLTAWDEEVTLQPCNSGWSTQDWIGRPTW